MAAHDDTMRNEKATVEKFQEQPLCTGRTSARVFPEFELLYGHMLQAFSRRAKMFQGKSTTMADTTSGFIQEKNNWQWFSGTVS